MTFSARLFSLKDPVKYYEDLYQAQHNARHYSKGLIIFSQLDEIADHT